MTADEFRWPIFHVYIQAASEAALKTLVDSTVLLIRNCTGQSITYQETSGTALFTMTYDDWPQAEAEIEVDLTDTTADIAFRIIGKTPGPLSTTGNQTGQVGELVWQYQLQTNQLAGMVAEGNFVKAGGNTALVNAQTWVEALDAGTRPGFVPAAMRVADAVFELTQIQNVSGEFSPVRATVMFREIPASLIASWPASVQDANYGVQVVETPMDTRSGQQANSTLLLAGQITVRTEGNTTFEGGLTKVAAGSALSTATTAINQIISHFEAVYAAFALHRMQDPVIAFDLDMGVARFQVLYESQGIVRWDERTTIRNEEPTTFSRASDGTDWLYEPNGGPIVTLTHTLEIESIGSPQAYRPPKLDRNWYRVEKDIDAVMGVQMTGGEIRYTVRGSSTWRYLNQAQTGPSSQRTSSTGIVYQDRIGRGNL